MVLCPQLESTDTQTKARDPAGGAHIIDVCIPILG